MGVVRVGWGGRGRGGGCTSTISVVFTGNGNEPKTSKLAISQSVSGVYSCRKLDVLGCSLIKAGCGVQSWEDEDVSGALEWLEKTLQDNIQLLSSFDRYRKEVRILFLASTHLPGSSRPLL